MTATVSAEAHPEPNGATTPEPAPARTAAFFDLDKTVIAKSSALAFSKPFFDQGLLNRRAVLKSSYAQFLFLMSGADRDQIDRMRSHVTDMCAGWDVEQIKTIVNETLHDIVDPLIFAEAAELIADHRLCGRDVVVVSASGEEIVAPIARALGATHAMASDRHPGRDRRRQVHRRDRVLLLRRGQGGRNPGVGRDRGLPTETLLRVLRLRHGPADAGGGRTSVRGQPRPCPA